LSSAVILPTSEYFPPPFSGRDDEVRALVGRVVGYMGWLATQCCGARASRPGRSTWTPTRAPTWSTACATWPRPAARP